MFRKAPPLASRLAIGTRNTFNQDSFSKSPRLQEKLDNAKERLKWRTKPGENTNAWYSKFKLFGDEEQNSDLITTLQQPIDLRPSAISKWWKKRNIRIERHLQMYMPERHEILGSDLATAHFVLYRGGTVKFLNQAAWVRADDNQEFDLPNRYDPKYKLEAVKCDNMTLYYEGVENIKRLQNLKFLSFRNVKTFDDWCLDRISGAENPKLEVLDLTGTLITERGLSSLYRLENLKLLIVDSLEVSPSFQLSCAMIEEFRPNLKIIASSEIHSQ